MGKKNSGEKGIKEIMVCMRCGTCHKLMTPTQITLCQMLHHEQPYDDEVE